jgi:hypothetical protein
MNHGRKRTALRAGFAGAVVVAGSVGPLAVAGSASAATLSVCPSGCQYTQLAPALAAAHDGDTITLGPGTYQGGVTVDASVNLVGAGASQTTISGGGPVLTIGTFGTSAAEPTVSISGVTVTGGVTRTSVFSAASGYGKDGAWAAGGGILIPPANANFDQTSQGATVTISNSVITGNRVAPSVNVRFPQLCRTCRFAQAEGGGIESFGTLTVTQTTISDNRIGSASGLSDLANYADGAGIADHYGALTVTDSRLYGNQATGTGKYAQSAEGGAIFIETSPSLMVTGSSITGNQTSVAASMPDGIDVGANSGGIHISGDVPTADIAKSTISDNSTTMTNTVGNSNAFSAAVHASPPTVLNLTADVFADNKVTSATLPGSTGYVQADSGVGERGTEGTITRVLMTGNTVSATSVASNVYTGGGVSNSGGTYIDSVISNNHITASAPNGAVYASGGGIQADTPGLTLQGTKVRGNSIDATGASGEIDGGGVFDANTGGGPMGGPLTLTNSSITGNSLTASPGITVHGGGLFLRDWPMTSTGSTIAGNTPDQCFGC